MMMVAMMGLPLVIIIRVIYNALELKEQQLREQNLENRLYMAERRYDLILQNINETRKLRHNMKYHMSVIRGLLETQSYTELEQYLDSYHILLAARDMELPLYAKNQTVNILAGYYAGQAKAEHIHTEFNIRIPPELPVDRAHLTVLLGNLWQNALEACRKLPPEAKRYIKTSILARQNKLMLQCVNSAEKIQKNEDGQYISAKGFDHGSGLSSVEDVVSLYGGFCEFDFNGHEFSCSIALPLPTAPGGMP